jgi:ribose transport system ATP-binding protein
MKILSGIYAKDSGSIVLEGREVEIESPRAAQELGISIVHQEMNLMPHLTVAQNIYIGREPRAGLFVRTRALNERAEELLTRLGIDLDPRELIENLTVAKQQMVEIAKALSFDAKVLIMDEPTSALTESETETLFTLIEALKATGTGIIYISHRMDELRRLSDRVTVLRDGAYIGSLTKSEIDIPAIIEMMVGRHIEEGARPESREHARDDVVLSVEGLNTHRLPATPTRRSRRLRPGRSSPSPSPWPPTSSKRPPSPTPPPSPPAPTTRRRPTTRARPRSRSPRALTSP